MLEPELKNYLEDLNKNLTEIKNRGAWWKTFLEGVLKGFGSVIGVAVALLAIGWVLNVIGIIPAFQQEAENWRELIEQTERRVPTPNGNNN